MDEKYRTRNMKGTFAGIIEIPYNNVNNLKSFTNSSIQIYENWNGTHVTSIFAWNPTQVGSSNSPAITYTKHTHTYKHNIIN